MQANAANGAFDGKVFGEEYLILEVGDVVQAFVSSVAVRLADRAKCPGPQARKKLRDANANSWWRRRSYS